MQPNGALGSAQESLRELVRSQHDLQKAKESVFLNEKVVSTG